LGVGCYVEGTGIGPYEGAHVRVEPSGQVFVASGLTTQGQGHATTFAQIAAEVLGRDPTAVTVVTGDSRRFNWGAGTYASRARVAWARVLAVLRAAAVHVRQWLPRVHRRGRRRHGRPQDPPLCGPARLRDRGESDDRRGADPRWCRPGDRWRLLRANRL